MFFTLFYVQYTEQYYGGGAHTPDIEEQYMNHILFCFYYTPKYILHWFNGRTFDV